MAGLLSGKLTLKDTADHCNRLHAEIGGIVKQGLGKAREIGKVLCVAKSAIHHGAFTAWVEHECDFSAETARRYMRVHEEWDELLERNGSRIADITFTEGIKQLAGPKKPSKNGQKKPVLPKQGGPVESSGVCSKGGAHEYETDPELEGLFCAKCHEARTEHQDQPPADQDLPSDPVDQGQPAAEEEAADRGAARRLADLFTRAEQLCGTMINLLDDINKLKPAGEEKMGNMRDGLQLLYSDIKTWRAQ